MILCHPFYVIHTSCHTFASTLSSAYHWGAVGCGDLENLTNVTHLLFAGRAHSSALANAFEMPSNLRVFKPIL
jgi:hypothetical protein